MKNGIRFLIKKIKPYKLRVTVITVLSVISSLSLILLPGQIQAVVNYIEENLYRDMSISDVRGPIVLFFVFLVIYSFGNFFQGKKMSDLSADFSAGLRKEIDSKINRLPLSYLDRQSEGDIQSRMINDVDTLTTSISGTIGSAVANLASLILCLVLMLTTNVFMTISLILATAIGLFLFSYTFKISQPQFVKQQKMLGKANGQINEVFSGHLVVKAFNCEEDVIREFEEKNRELYTSSLLSRFLSGLMQPVMTFSGNLGYIAVCVTGAALLVSDHGGVSVGKIVAFILYANLFSSPVSGLIQFVSSLQPAAACADRISEILEAEEMTEETVKESLKSVSGNVRFEHVRFGYSPDQTIIHDLSATVTAGQKVAIVGPTGAGKSTLVNLLMRFYDTDSGQIYIDDIPVKSISREELHKHIGMVLQDVWTFKGSIRENVVYGKEDVSDEELKRVLKDAGLEFFVNSLPDGADSVISEQSEVSAGQKQLLTIARAMVKNAPILILDEATSNIDTRTELLIQSAIDKLTAGRTSFVIAHRLSTIRNADQIFVMKDGDVIEIGTHEELLEKGGLYSELYYSQFDDNKEAG
ncbi:MAG: ABC transporter ATP-binding protein/permease [Lachnospiraceae bacterium]|nr:ABC transporter ATP-binding protein/permease [Lachnospiraceae bacterium]